MSRETEEKNLLGRELGIYELVDVVGRGAHGVVFRARDTRQLDTWRAVKVMGGPIAELTAFKFRLPNEMRTAIQLSHPNIVPVYQFGSDDGLQYVAMEYVDSVSLDEYLRTVAVERRHTDPTVQRRLRDVAAALDYAHGQRVVHAGVRPSNVLLRAGDRYALLTDFCLSRAVTVERMVEAGIDVDCAFRSPEQCAKVPAELTPASDIYSLAAVLWYVATGSPPFGSGMDARARHIEEPVPDLARAAPHLPVGLQPVFARGLAKSPGQRYQRAAQLVTDFTTGLTPRPQAAPPLRRPTQQAPPRPVVPVAPAPPVAPAWTPPVHPVEPAYQPAVQVAPEPPPPRARTWAFAAATNVVELRDSPLWRPFPGDEPAPRRKREWRIPWVPVLLGLFVIAVVTASTIFYFSRQDTHGLQLGNVKTTPTPLVDLSPITGPTVGTLPQPATGVAGTAVRVAGMRLTVLSTAAGTIAPPTVPPAGSHFLAVQVVYDNSSGAAVPVSPYDWVLADADGNLYGAVTTGLPDDLQEGSVQQAAQARGIIGFMVPDGARGLALHWSAEVGDESAVVALP